MPSARYPVHRRWLPTNVLGARGSGAPLLALVATDGRAGSALGESCWFPDELRDSIRLTGVACHPRVYERTPHQEILAGRQKNIRRSACRDNSQERGFTGCLSLGREAQRREAGGDSRTASRSSPPGRLRTLGGPERVLTVPKGARLHSRQAPDLCAGDRVMEMDEPNNSDKTKKKKKKKQKQKKKQHKN